MLKNPWARRGLLLLVAYYAYPGFNYVASNGRRHVRELLVDRNQQWVRKNDPAFAFDADSMQAKCSLPADARVALDPRLETGLEIKAGYFLFPFILQQATGNWTHMLYYPKILPPGARLASQHFGDDVVLAARPGHGFVKGACDDVSDQTRHKAFLLFSIVLTVEIICGFLILSLLDIKIGEMGILWFIGTCFLLGAAALNLPLWLLYLMGMEYDPAHIVLVWASIFALLSAFMAKAPRKYALDLLEDYRRPFLPRGPLGKAFYFAALIAALWIGGAMVLQAAYYPVSGWDPYGYWVYHAKAISTNFSMRNGNLPNGNPYPMLWHFTLAPLFSLAGNVDYDDHVMWVLAATIFALIGQIVGAMRQLGVKGGWEYLAVVLYFSAAYTDAVFSQPYADVPLTAYCLACVAAAMTWLRFPESRKYLILTLLLGFGMAMIKLEGSPGVLFVGLALAACMSGPLRESRRLKVFFLLSLPVLVELGWIAYMKHLGWIHDVNQARSLFVGGITAKFMQLGAILQVIVLWCGSVTKFAFAVVVLALMAWGLDRESVNRRFLFAALMLALMFSFGFVAFFGWTPQNILAQWDTALPRVLMHAGPLMAIILTALIVPISEGGATPNRNEPLQAPSEATGASGGARPSHFH